MKSKQKTLRGPNPDLPGQCMPQTKLMEAIRPSLRVGTPRGDTR